MGYRFENYTIKWAINLKNYTIKWAIDLKNYTIKWAIKVCSAFPFAVFLFLSVFVGLWLGMYLGSKVMFSCIPVRNLLISWTYAAEYS